MKKWQALTLLGGLASLFVACIPKRGRTDFTVKDWRLAKAFTQAAKNWADNGVEIAQRITVTWGGKGVPVRFAELGKLTEVCESNNRHGCATYTSSGQDFEGIWILEGLTDIQLSKILMHELMHVLIPPLPHLADNKVGIMNAVINSDFITTDDLTHVCAYTPCGDPPEDAGQPSELTVEKWQNS